MAFLLELLPEALGGAEALEAGAGVAEVGGAGAAEAEASGIWGGAKKALSNPLTVLGFGGLFGAGSELGSSVTGSLMHWVIPLAIGIIGIELAMKYSSN
jgi:hypothetical protein